MERAMQRLAEEQARLGHEVHVITSYSSGSGSKEDIINGVHIHRIEVWRFRYPDLTIPREIPRKILEDIDVVHGWGQNSLFTYMICREAKRLGKPVVLYFLGVDYLRHHYKPLMRVFGYLYQKWITRQAIKLADLALVTNEIDGERLRRVYRVDPMILLHGVDETYLKTPNMATKFRNKYGVEGRIITYIGRIHPTKGLDLLISAFADVARELPDLKLVIAGKGDKKYLRKCLELAEKLRISDKVRYIGYIPEEDKIALIDASDTVVLPSRHAGESYPLLIDEVLARHKPLIITKVPAAQRVKENLLCKVVQFGKRDLALAIREMLVTKPLLNSSDRTANLLSWRAVAVKSIEIYGQVLSAEAGKI